MGNRIGKIHDVCELKRKFLGLKRIQIIDMAIYIFMLILLFVTRPAYAFLGALMQPISVLKGISQSRNTKIGQQLTCYDFPNRSGDSLVATNYISSLAEYHFDNRAESCCASGVWILYTGHGYTSRIWWLYGTNYCTRLPRQFLNSISSLRFTGAPDDMHFDNISMRRVIIEKIVSSCSNFCDIFSRDFN